MSGAGFPTFSDDLGLRSSEKLETPDVWVKSSDLAKAAVMLVLLCLNPRFVGQVFRRIAGRPNDPSIRVLIPDTWGKSSDLKPFPFSKKICVLIPDTWGKSSDITCFVVRASLQES